MSMAFTLACGPYIDLDEPRVWMALVTFLALKPVAYFAFIHAFRYRVNRPIPMSFGRAAKLALARAGLGVVLLATGAAAVMITRSDTLLAWSWLYLYAGRVVAWFVVGRRPSSPGWPSSSGSSTGSDAASRCRRGSPMRGSATPVDTT